MKFTLIFNFIRHISKMGSASGKMRIAYAFANILIMGLAVFFAVCVKWCWDIMMETSFIGGLLGLILCVGITIIAFLQGFVAQIALVIIAGIGIANPQERGGNIVAFIIALLTSIGLVIVGIILLNIL